MAAGNQITLCRHPDLPTSPHQPLDWSITGQPLAIQLAIPVKKSLLWACSEATTVGH